MLDSMLVREYSDVAELEAYFLQALYWSVGGVLLEDGRVKFDQQVKQMASLNQVGDEAGPGMFILIHQQCVLALRRSVQNLAWV